MSVGGALRLNPFVGFGSLLFLAEMEIARLSPMAAEAVIVVVLEEMVSSRHWAPLPEHTLATVTVAATTANSQLVFV